LARLRFVAFEVLVVGMGAIELAASGSPPDPDGLDGEPGRRLEAPSCAALLADVSVDSVPLLKLMYIFGSLGVGPKHP
jgi:hypothetical protein